MAYSSIIENFSVSTVLGELFFEDEFIAVLRSIDSSRSVEDIVRILNFHEIEFLINNFNVCLIADALKDSLKKELFTGFDEVWLFKAQLPQICLEGVPYSTADAMYEKNQMDPKTLEVFENVRCELLLADGVDLWVAAREKKVFEFVLGLSEG